MKDPILIGAGLGALTAALSILRGYAIRSHRAKHDRLHPGTYEICPICQPGRYKTQDRERNQ
jgi:hypothetical protein